MRYMMLIHHDDEALAAAPKEQLWAEYAAFNDALGCRGRRLGGAHPRAPWGSTTGRISMDP